MDRDELLKYISGAKNFEEALHKAFKKQLHGVLLRYTYEFCGKISDLDSGELLDEFIESFIEGHMKKNEKEK